MKKRQSIILYKLSNYSNISFQTKIEKQKTKQKQNMINGRDKLRSSK